MRARDIAVRWAVAKSAKPLANHSLARGLIENFSLVENFAEEAVAEFQAVLDYAWRSDDEIEREGSGHGVPDSCRLMRGGTLVRHHHKEIDIRVFGGCTFGH
jgi:hypothetical protein